MLVDGQFARFDEGRYRFLPVNLKVTSIAFTNLLVD